MNNYNFFNLNFKGIIAFLFLSFFLVKANAQLQLEEFNGSGANKNQLLIASDTKLPIHDGMCRKLLSEITLGSKGTWSRYYLKDVPQEGQWYKDFVFLKIMAPNENYFNERLSIFDVANNKYWEYLNNVDNKIYMHLTEKAPDPTVDRFYYDYINNQMCLTYMYVTKKKVYRLSPVQKNEDTFLEFIPFDSKEEKPVYYYEIANADFINEKVPDNSVKTDANYLFLQRDYKLGGRYNTVIFPVDVPVKDYNHLYNNGSNRMKVYRLDAIETNSLHFVSDTDGILKANTPYIIKSQNNDGSTPDDVVSEYYMTETPVEYFDINCIKQVKETDGIKVFAQYKKSVTQYNDNISPDEDIYIVSGNKLLDCRKIKEAKVDRFRWYIKRPRHLSAVPMTMTFDGTTEIETAELETTSSNYDVYTISGQKVGTTDDINSLQRGYYIINGKVRFVAE